MWEDASDLAVEGVLPSSTTCISPTATADPGYHFTVPKGKRVAIVGPSGSVGRPFRVCCSGSTTAEGTVRIDGQNLKSNAEAFARRSGWSAGHGDVQRHHRLQHRLWPSWRVAGQIEQASEMAAIGGCRQARQWLRHHGRRARPEAFGRREAACRRYPRHPEAPVDLPVRQGRRRRSTAAPKEIEASLGEASRRGQRW